jgi:hypothetical protein
MYMMYEYMLQISCSQNCFELSGLMNIPSKTLSLSLRSISRVTKSPETVFKEEHIVWDLMPELTITHLISSAIYSLYKGKRVDWGRSLLLVEHIYILLLLIS